MKHLNNWSKFTKIYEKYGNLRKFYHKTSKDYIDSFNNGIELNRSTERGQGDGFYVFTDLEIVKTIGIIKGPHHGGFGLTQDCIIEIESVFNETNFDLDYELVKSLEKIIETIVNKSGKKSFELNYQETKFIIVTDDNLNQNDFIISQPDDSLSGWIWKIESNKSSNFAYYKKGLSQEVGLVSQVKEYIDSFDRIGLKNEIEKECFKVIDEQPMALRYVGEKIYPTRYMTFENGIWSDWKSFIK